jgi:hypothetical protein
MCVDVSFDADPVKIHRRIKTHYMKYFSVIPSSLIQRLGLDLPDLGSKAVWESFFQDPAAMIEAYLNSPAGVAPTNIPRQYVEAIARAFQQSAAANAMEQELSELMQIPFLFEEFLKALGH